MSPRVLSIGLTTACLLASMVAGAVLLTPSIAKEESGKDQKVEKRVIVKRHGGPQHEMSADELKDMVGDLRDALSDERANSQERLADAQRLLDKANDALKDGDTAVAQALVHEAARLLHHGPSMFEHDAMMFAPGAPGMPGMGFGGPGFGPGEKRLMIQTEIEDLDIERDGDQVHLKGSIDGKKFDVKGTREEVQAKLKELGIKSEIIDGGDFMHGAKGMHMAPMPHGGMGFGPGEKRLMIKGDHEELELEIERDGDQVRVKGTKDGKDFDVKGTREEVQAKLKALGIESEMVEGGDFMAQGMGGFAPGAHMKIMKFEELSDEERAELKKEIAGLTDEADKLFEQGKTDEALEVLTKAGHLAHKLNGPAIHGPMGLMAPMNGMDWDSFGPEIQREVRIAIEEAEDAGEIAEGEIDRVLEEVEIIIENLFEDEDITEEHASKPSEKTAPAPPAPEAPAAPLDLREALEDDRLMA